MASSLTGAERRGREAADEKHAALGEASHRSRRGARRSDKVEDDLNAGVRDVLGAHDKTFFEL